MIDSIVGVIIMTAATTSLVLAVQVGGSAFRTAGKYPLTAAERELLSKAGYTDARSASLLQSDLETYPSR